jgi:hypothetical protein
LIKIAATKRTLPVAMLHCKRGFCCTAKERLTGDGHGRSVPRMSLGSGPSLVLHRSTILAACSAMLAACGGGDELCARDTDCPSGFCKADGTCGSASDTDAGTDAPPDGSTVLCMPDHDGAITRGEVPLAAGKMANFRIATDPTFQTAGVDNGDGTRTWNLGVALAGDADREIALLSPTGTWWAADFPMATYATTLAAGSDLLGVFRLTGNELALLGVVSPEPGTFQTSLEYDPPATILALPVQAAGTWSSTSTISGTAQGAIIAYTESYTSTVDHSGTMTTPYGDFPVIRVATDLERTQGFSTLSTSRTFAWLAECFGTVATVTSQEFESAAEFDDPAEVRRLAP